MRNPSVRHFAAAFCLVLALTLVLAPTMLPTTTAPDQTAVASWTTRGPRDSYYARILRNLRRLLGMGTEDALAPPLPKP